MLKLLFHLLAAVQFFYGCYYDHTYVKIPSDGPTPFGGKLRYLTFLNAMLQTVYFAVAALNDVARTNENTSPSKPLVRRIKDIMFSSLAFPLSLFVCVSFWGIYAIDRELILPRSLDPYFPIWLNHVLHTNIMLCSMIELVSTFRMYPQKKFGLSVLTTFMLSYMVWVHIVYFKSNHWVYPILAVLNWPLRIIFYLFSLGFACALYNVGDYLNRAVWSKEIEETVKSGKKKEK